MARTRPSRAMEKSQLVVQAFNDAGKASVLTQSPTIQRMSQRLILSLAACKLATNPNAALMLRDISQAYVQSDSRLSRNFFVNPNADVRRILGLGDDKLLRIIKPLYGIPEAGNHWFSTYSRYHIEKLQMKPSTYDACLMMTADSGVLGVVGLQTDDTLLLADKTFASREESELKKAGFLAKPRETLSSEQPLKFNGGMVTMHGDSLILSQERQVANLAIVTKELQVNKGTRGKASAPLNLKEQYVTQRARGAYIASVCQPEAAFDLSSAAQHTDPDESEVKALNARLAWQKSNGTRGLRFVPLDEDTLSVVAFTDAAFANNKDASSQIGYVVVVCDASGRANVVHWSSIKCKT